MSLSYVCSLIFINISDNKKTHYSLIVLFLQSCPCLFVFFFFLICVLKLLENEYCSGNSSSKVLGYGLDGPGSIPGVGVVEIFLCSFMTMKILISSVLISISIIILIKIQIRIKNQETISFLINNSITHIPLIKLYRTPTRIITILLDIYLFLTLIAVVKITNIFKGPLRQSN